MLLSHALVTPVWAGKPAPAPADEVAAAVLALRASPAGAETIAQKLISWVPGSPASPLRAQEACVVAFSTHDPVAQAWVALCDGGVGDLLDPIVPDLMSRVAASATTQDLEQCVYLLAVAGPARRDGEGLLRRLASGTSAPVGVWASVALARMGVHDIELAHRLARAVGSGREALMRVWAAQGLRSLGPAASDAVPALIRAASSAESAVATAAWAALREIGPGAHADLPWLAAHISERDPVSAATVLEVLASMGAAAASALPAVQGVLRDVRAGTALREVALSVAAQIAAATPERDPVLEWVCAEAVAGPAWYSVASVLAARATLGDAAALPELRKLATSPSDDVAVPALEAIGDLRSLAAPAVPELRAGLACDTRARVLASLRSVIRVPGAGIECADELRPLLHDRSLMVTMQAAMALAPLGDIEVLADLVTGLEEDEPAIRHACAARLAEAATAVPLAAKAFGLSKRTPDEVVQAWSGLAKLRAGDPSERRLALELLSHEDEAVRLVASVMLAEVRDTAGMESLRQLAATGAHWYTRMRAKQVLDQAVSA